MPSEVTAIASAARMACGSRAAVFNMGARLCGAALGFVLAVALARSMEPAGFAQVSAVFAWLAVATVLGCLGMPLVAVRFIGENLAVGRHDLARGVVVFALGASAGASALLVGIAWGVLHAGWFPLTPQSLRVADLGLALVLPNVLLTVVAGVLQALNHAVLAEVLSSVLRSLMMIIGLAWIWSRDAQEKLNVAQRRRLRLQCGDTIIESLPARG